MPDDKLAQMAQEIADLADELLEPCPTCDGTGLCGMEDTFECPDCDGEGWTEI